MSTSFPFRVYDAQEEEQRMSEMSNPESSFIHEFTHLKTVDQDSFESLTFLKIQKAKL